MPSNQQPDTNRRHVLIGIGVIAALMAWHAESSAHGNGNGAVATVTVSVPAEVDAHVRSDLDVRRNDNYGRQQVLMVGTSRGATGLPAGAADAIRSLLRFNLSGLPPMRLVSADLVMRIYAYGSGASTSQFTVQAHRIVPSGARTPWTEGNGFEGWPTNAPAGSADVDAAFGVAWSGAGDNPAPDAANNVTQPDFDPMPAAIALVPRTLIPAGAIVRWNVTDLVSRWRSGQVPNLGLVLRDPTTAGDFRELYFDAKDGAAQPNRDPNWTTPPTLQMVFQAEPADRDDCRWGGWALYPLRGFRNQGECVSWVSTREPHGRGRW